MAYFIRDCFNPSSSAIRSASAIALAVAVGIPTATLVQQLNIALGALDMLCNKLGFVNKKAEQQLCQQQKQQFRIKTHDMSLPANSLSGGNQQKVVLAKWLSRDVDVLILDEPTRGIDVGSKEEIYHLITELARQGKAIIMISSDLPEVLGMSDRIMVMYEGRVMGELSAEEATQERVLAYSFGHTDAKQEETI